MNKQLFIQIPKPCSANWDEMTAVDKGRFCQSCAKQVVDFSVMTDRQVLNYLNQSTGKLCGRFAEDQLQRPFTPVREEPRKSLWLAAVMPFLLLFEKAQAQKKVMGKPNLVVNVSLPEKRMLQGKVLRSKNSQHDVGKTANNVTKTLKGNKEKETIVMEGMVKLDTTGTRIGSIGRAEIIPAEKVITVNSIYSVRPAVNRNEFIIKGNIKDEINNVVPFATVQLKGEKTTVVADKDGNFSMPVTTKKPAVTLVFNCIGYEIKEMNVSLNAAELTKVPLHSEAKILPAITVNVNADVRCTRATLGDIVVIAGGLTTYTYKRVTPIDTAKAIVRKLFRNEAFRVFPNPVKSGGQFKVDVLKEGNYSIQLLNEQSALLSAENFIAVKGSTLAAITIPANAAAGIYFVRVVDEIKKKQYTDKILVQ